MHVCTICRHAEREAIKAALIAPEPVRLIACLVASNMEP
jgi:hypothetical protein